jgi:DNA-binding IclR family transcriptional regulator
MTSGRRAADILRDVSNQSISRAIALMRSISSSPGRASVSELARTVGLSRTTASRLLATLEQYGLVERASSADYYTLGYELARLGRLAEPYAGVVARAEPLMRALAERSGESVTLSVPTPDDDIDFIHQVDGPRLIGGRWWVGQRFPLHASSSGKVLLAEPRGAPIVEKLPARLPVCATRTIRTREALVEDLDGVRERGYAITRDELEDGLLGISVPIRDDRRELFAILSVSGPTYRMDSEAREPVLVALRQAAESIVTILFCSDPRSQPLAETSQSHSLRVHE